MTMPAILVYRGKVPSTVRFKKSFFHLLEQYRHDLWGERLRERYNDARNRFCCCIPYNGVLSLTPSQRILTLSERDLSSRSTISSTFSVISRSWSREWGGISIDATFCIILARSFLANALDWISSDSVRRSISIACGIAERPICRSECAKIFDTEASKPVFYN